MRRGDYPLVELAQGPIAGRCARAYTVPVQLHCCAAQERPFLVEQEAWRGHGRHSRYDPLDRPFPLGARRRPPEEDAEADDRQIGLHRRRQHRRGHAGQPRVLGLRRRIDGAAPLRIVGDFRGELGQKNVAARKVEGGRRADRTAQSTSLVHPAS